MNSDTHLTMPFLGPSPPNALGQDRKMRNAENTMIPTIGQDQHNQVGPLVLRLAESPLLRDHARVTMSNVRHIQYRVVWRGVIIWYTGDPPIHPFIMDPSQRQDSLPLLTLARALP